MANVRKINQAACILSGFNFDGVSYCDIAFYFATDNGEVYGSGVNSFDEENFREWGKKEWSERILDSARWYTERGHRLTHVASVIITFHTKDQDEMEDPLYTIEMTDLSNGFFDRILIDSSPCLDVDCTTKESSRIRGARDVVKLIRRTPQARTNRISTDVPRIVLAAKNLF